ncbi:MAG: hypothetical protein KBD63_01905 [Bacteriovoracaceae bacterium]|nr:hypothetical protein [Bacteriovoracaceae bacterium]
MNFLISFIFILFSYGCHLGKKNTQKIASFPLHSDISSLDPALVYDSVTSQITYSCYETLYEYHYLKRPFTLQPLLAESMPSLSENKTKITIKIKPQIAYHPDPAFKGQVRFVKAQDFINGFKRLAFEPLKSNGWWLVDGKIKGINEFRKKVGSDLEKFYHTDIEGLSAPDDYTLIIKLNNAHSPFLFSLAMTFTAPIPLEAITFYQNNLSDHMIGTGPFILKEKTESFVKMQKFPDYQKRAVLYPHDGDRQAHDQNLLDYAGKTLPFLDELHFYIIKEEEDRWQSFLQNKIDIHVLVKEHLDDALTTTGTLQKKWEKKNINLRIAPTLILWWIGFNMQDPIIGKNKNLRKAIAHAINMDEFVQKFTHNMAQKANSIYIPGVFGYSPSTLPPYSFNRDKAKWYLKEAGYPDGKNLPPLRFETRNESSLHFDMAKFIEQQLQQININLEIVVNTFPTFLEKSKKGKNQIWQDGWNLDYPDAENLLQLLTKKSHSPGPNKSFYVNSEFEKLYSNLLESDTLDKKNDLMLKMQNIIFEDVPWILQYYDRRYILVQSKLKNFRYSDFNYNVTKYLDIDN